MAREEIKTHKLTPDEHSELEALIEKVANKAASLEEFSQPDPQSVGNILEERKGQRKIVFYFAIGSAVVSFLLLFTIIAIQSYVRIFTDHQFTLLNGYELEVLSVSVFGQILGIIYIIAKSIWDDSMFKDFYKGK
jgi:hypothetical protein